MINRRRFLQRGFTTSAALSFAGLSAVSASAQERLTVHDAIQQSLDDAELSMLFAGQTAAECRAWQAGFRAELNRLLGDSRPPAEWSVAEEKREELDDHVRYQLLLQADGVPSLPVYLLVPRGLNEGQRGPGVLCVHGHGPFGHDAIVGRHDLDGVTENIRKHNYDYGLQFVRRGYVVAAPCMIPFGRRVDRDRYRGVDPCLATFLRMQALGQLPMAANLRDLKWSLDLLQKRPEVQPERLGCAGLSYGGRMAMLVTAMDERIKAAAVSGALNLLQERTSKPYGCGSQIIPGLLKYGDYSEVGSLIAPRPCVWETGSTDPLVVPKWDDVFRSRLRRSYDALDATDKLYFDRFAGGHVWSGRVAFPLFDKVLKE